MNMKGTLNRRSAGDRPVWRQFVFTAIFLLVALSAFAVPPPTGVAPVTVPAGGFAIYGDLPRNNPIANSGNWMPGPGCSGGAVLGAKAGALKPPTNFQFIHPLNLSQGHTFI